MGEYLNIMKSLKDLTILQISYYYANEYYLKFKDLLEFDELVNEIYILLESYIIQNNKLPINTSMYITRKLKSHSVNNNVPQNYSNVYTDILIGDTCVKYCLYKDLIEQVEKCLDILTPREYFVIKCRYGFNNTEPQTLQEISKSLCLSPERIRQINAKALRKLRNFSKTKYLIDY